MTRGKYAARAALRREDAGVRSEIGSYQHHVKRLTAENKELSATLSAEQTARKEEVRRLKAQLDEALSPEMLALREELEHQRERADHAAREMTAMRKKWDAAFLRMHDLLAGATDGTQVDALDALIQFCDPDVNLGSLAGAGTVHEGARRQLGEEASRRIDRARRYTSGHDQLRLGKPPPSRFDRWVDPK
jgi:hypothetical protein